MPPLWLDPPLNACWDELESFKSSWEWRARFASVSADVLGTKLRFRNESLDAGRRRCDHIDRHDVSREVVVPTDVAVAESEANLHRGSNEGRPVEHRAEVAIDAVCEKCDDFVRVGRDHVAQFRLARGGRLDRLSREREHASLKGRGGSRIISPVSGSCSRFSSLRAAGRAVPRPDTVQAGARGCQMRLRRGAQDGVLGVVRRRDRQRQFRPLEGGCDAADFLLR